MTPQSGRIVEADKLRELCADRNLKFAPLARDADLSYSCVKKMLDGRPRVNLTRTVKAIAAALTARDPDRPVTIDDFSHPATSDTAAA